MAIMVSSPRSLPPSESAESRPCGLFLDARRPLRRDAKVRFAAGGVVASSSRDAHAAAGVNVDASSRGMRVSRVELSADAADWTSLLLDRLTDGRRAGWSRCLLRGIVISDFVRRHALGFSLGFSDCCVFWRASRLALESGVPGVTVAFVVGQ